MEHDPGTKPFFNVALGAAETTYLTVPPFSFPGVTARVFLLQAKMDVLSSFCERYLNVAPKKICFLRPCLPCVLLVVLDYGQGVIETANLGWVSQHEVYFAVPLERWHRRKGRMVFDGWVLNTPFIFVDSAASVTTGREVYGWPKVFASLRPRKEDWLVAPHDPLPLLSLSVQGFGSRDAEKVPLLEIVQDLGQAPAFTPAALASVDPLPRLSRTTRGAWWAGAELATLLLRSPFSGFGPQRAGGESVAETLVAGLRGLFDFTRNPGVDVVTLKQFRDTGHPNDICYQALVKSRLPLDRYNDGGPLGFYNFLQGDATGGFRIRLYESSSFPIVSSLGLQTVREPADGGGGVSILEPLFPFWLNVDLSYRRGENLGWRILGSPWYGKEDEVVRSSQPSDLYNTVAGAGRQEWVGLYDFPKAFCDVFPLRVYDEAQLALFISDYLDHRGERHTFKPLGSHVYMVASRGRFFYQAESAMVSQIAVYVPLLWYEEGRLQGVVLAVPYAFVDNPTYAITMREIRGIPAIDAKIETPRHSWLRQGPVLRVRTQVFPVLDAGVGAEQRTLIDVVPPPSPSAWSSPPSGGPREVHGPVTRKLLTLKQFPDARDPDLACYQALVLEPWTIFWTPPRPLGAETRVRIYRYPSLPLTKTLGLVDPTEPPMQSPKKKTTRAIVDVLTPEDPFRIELDIKVEPAEVLSRTAGNLPWIPHPRTEERANEAELKSHMEIVRQGPQEVFRALLGPAPAADAPGGGSSPAGRRTAGKGRGGGGIS